MASKVVTGVVKTTAGGVVPVSQKYTVQSVGVWERIRRAFAIDPNRSNGVPLVPYNRNPSPGSLDPLAYDDPVTIPAGDIADNPYWKRDARRNYPRLSVVGQAEAVALLSVGSASHPRVELVGENGSKQLVAAQEAGKTGGLAKYFEGTGVEAGKLVLAETGGLPPLPSGEKLREGGKWDVYKYQLAEEPSYSEAYPCRSFS
ncbi:NADH-ubiquinone oxidoreductase 21.3 kDa subunit [Neurospora hispaniola]|uniref:NADH-ubiquinone oxidoreductase 21.3 kDa subunit n=1 Tax=Neurospora hispaniola TaxID=588809 RepID=A0AAJ0IH14_9PEZI|nr:NADH-ubiquinone oxidoreductase 21.3 kDa subunit [Neurospora hispaniola]